MKGGVPSSGTGSAGGCVFKRRRTVVDLYMAFVDFGLWCPCMSREMMYSKIYTFANCFYCITQWSTSVSLSCRFPPKRSIERWMFLSRHIFFKSYMIFVHIGMSVFFRLGHVIPSCFIKALNFYDIPRDTHAVLQVH